MAEAAVSSFLLANHFANRFEQPIAQPVHQLRRHGRSGHNRDDIPQRSGEEASPTRGQRDLMTDALLRCEGLLSRFVGDQFDADEDSLLSDLADMRPVAKLRQSLSQEPRTLCRVVEDSVVLEQFQRR